MKAGEIIKFLGLSGDSANVSSDIPESYRERRAAIGPKEALFSWKVSRKYNPVQINPRIKKTFTMIGLAVGFLFLLMQEFAILLVVASVLFLLHAFSSSSETTYKYEISTHGLQLDGGFYYWDQLEKFFFTGYVGESTLAVDVSTGVPPRLILYYLEKDKQKIIDAMSRYIPYLEYEPVTFVDKMYRRVVDKFDFEDKK